MSQSKTWSAIEAGTNIIVGIALSAAVTYWLMPLWGFVPKLHEALEITALFTAVSFARQYGLRRLFNHMPKSSQNMSISGKCVR